MMWKTTHCSRPLMALVFWGGLLLILPPHVQSSTTELSCPFSKCTCQIDKEALSEVEVMCSIGILDTIPAFSSFSQTISRMRVSNIHNSVLKNNSFVPLMNVKEIYLNDNHLVRIDGAAFVGVDANLELMDLSHNQLEQLQFLTTHNFPQLKRLLLRDNRLSIIRSDSFALLPQLTELNLDENKLGGHLNFLRQPNLRSIVDLNMDANWLNVIDPMDFQHLTNLQVLRLGRNRLTDASFLASSCFKKLLGIGLGSNLIAKFEGIWLDDKRLVWIDLSDNRLTDATFLTSCGLIKLEDLDLSNNFIGIIPDNAFQATRSLIEISLTGNNLTTLPKCALARFYYKISAFAIANNPIQCDCRIAWLSAPHQLPAEGRALCSNIDYTYTNNFDVSRCSTYDERCSAGDHCSRFIVEGHTRALASVGSGNTRTLSYTLVTVKLIAVLLFTS